MNPVSAAPSVDSASASPSAGWCASGLGNAAPGGLQTVGVRFALLFAVLIGLVAGVFALSLYLFAPGGLQSVPPVAFIAASAAAALSVGATFLLARELSRRLQQLTASARTIASGDLSAAINVDCNCEVGILADSMRSMVERLRANFEQISKLALFDSVTGLPNRHHMVNCLTQRLSSETAGAGTIMYLDLNGFKKVNDTFGHAIGDKLLRACADRISLSANGITVEQNASAARDPRRACTSPMLARFGGDEFVMHIPDVHDIGSLNEIADRIRLMMAQPFDIDGRAIYVGVAVGVARYPVDGRTPDAVLRHADFAMYGVKNRGSQELGVYHPSMLAEVEQQQGLERDLNKALTSGELEVFYQPKVSAADNALVGVEALVRWNHPDRGLLGPGSFIEIAEITGLIRNLGSTVLDIAIAQCAEMAREGHGIDVAINVSLAQLENPGFAARVLELIEKHSAPAHLLTLELTESIASINIDLIEAQMRPLRAVGVKFAIDDFGTGYSNLAQMMNLKFDELKIDRSLIANIGKDAQFRSAIQMIVSLGNSLGCRVLAEGVETAEQLGYVRMMGCHEVQGFHFARPMPVYQFKRWRRKWAAARSQEHKRELRAAG